MASSQGSGSQIRRLWSVCRRLPGGRRLFSLMLGRIVPYTGTVSPHIMELRDGYALATMRDRRRVRNHLRSIHAIAMVNLAEVSSGLALIYALPADARAILVNISIDYLKKGRGTLTAEARCPIPPNSERMEYDSVAVLRDEEGDEVARATARWLVSPLS